MKKMFLFVLLAAGFALQSQHTFAQQNTVFYSQINYDATLSNLWGYADNNREYAIVGTTAGTYVVDVTNPVSPVQVGFVPGGYSFWREIKTWSHYAYVVDDEAGEGLVIIDLSALPSGGVTATNWYGNNGVSFTRSHTIFIDENGVAYLFGANYGQGGAIMVDLAANPTNPNVLGVYDGAYIHDGYARNDTLWAGQIYDGRLMAIDVTDKTNPVELGFVHTPGNFTHNCWMSDDGKTIFTTDEVSSSFLTSYDITDVTDIRELDRIQSNPGSGVIIHNTYVRGNFVVSSYYRDGVTIHDATYPDNLIQVASYDTSPLSGDGFNGAWGVYPYLPSGNLLVSDMEEGLFVIGAFPYQAAYLTGAVSDADTGQPLAGVEVTIVSGTSLPKHTNLEGVYNTGTLDGGNYSIQFTKAGYEPLVLPDVFLINGIQTTLNAAMQPLPNFTFQGQVLNMSWQPVPNAQVRFTNPDFNYLVTTNSEGYFWVPSFYNGNYDIIAGKWGYRTFGLTGQEIPIDAPFLTIQLEDGYYDDFAFDFGWTTSGTSDTGGEWTRQNPTGTTFGGGQIFNPEDDVNSDFGTECFVTGNADLFDFVNNGTVTLTSPPFDLTQYGDAWLSYQLWFVNLGQFGLGTNDKVTVKLSNGTDEATLQLLEGPDTQFPLWNWTPYTFQVSQYLAPTANMRLTIEATADFNQNELLECGFDVLSIVDSTGTVGIQNLPLQTTAQAQVSPNPFTTQTTITLPNIAGNTPLLLTLFDVTGRPIYSQTAASGNTIYIQRNNLPPGLYLYAVTNATGTTLARGKLAAE